jgi:formylmethanofuran dehydrogenase subunit B
LTCGEAGLAATLAALRALCAGRRVSAPVANFDLFAKALAEARFPVFLFSGHAADALALEMLQGLIGDLNATGRASGLHLTASESGWGSAQASTWMTGFPPRTGFSRGFPEYDPWRFDVARMIAAGEADCHVWISGSAERTPPKPRKDMPLVALAKTPEPVAGAAVTIHIGKAGVDHDGVGYSSRIGTLVALKARSPTDLSSAAAILRAIADQIPAGAMPPC